MSSIHFNLDLTISNERNSLSRTVLTHHNIHSFCECKHYRTFYPSICAYFIGLNRFVMPQNILWSPIINNHLYPPPAILVSGNASPDVFKLNNLVRKRKYPNQVYRPSICRLIVMSVRRSGRPSSFRRSLRGWLVELNFSSNALA